jgi:hypothetical protein
MAVEGERMNAAHKGRRAERRARALLEAAGFEVCRAAGSKGPADLVAWDTTSIRFISIEREALQFLPRPGNSSVEIWRFPTAAARH